MNTLSLREKQGSISKYLLKLYWAKIPAMISDEYESSLKREQRVLNRQKLAKAYCKEEIRLISEGKWDYEV